MVLFDIFKLFFPFKIKKLIEVYKKLYYGITILIQYISIVPSINKSIKQIYSIRKQNREYAHLIEEEIGIEQNKNANTWKLINKTNAIKPET